MSAVSLEYLPSLRPGQQIDFTSPAGFPAAVTGFGAPGGLGSWSVGRRTAVYFRANPAAADQPVSLAISLAGYVVPGKHGSVAFDLTVDGQVVGSHEVTDVRVRDVVVDLPARATQAPGGGVELGIRVHRPVSPASLGVGRDERLLGLLVSRIRVVPTTPE